MQVNQKLSSMLSKTCWLQYNSLFNKPFINIGIQFYINIDSFTKYKMKLNYIMQCITTIFPAQINVIIKK